LLSAVLQILRQKATSMKQDYTEMTTTVSRWPYTWTLILLSILRK